MNKKPLIILTGPTAVGKTAASIQLAKTVGGEIISADSMQIYQQMNIGTAKITPEEMQGIPHHLVDAIPPDTPFHVYEFKKMAEQAMHEIWRRGHIPVVVGGTGFYIQALLYDIDFNPEENDHSYRAELEELAGIKGTDFLHDWLKRIDPVSAECIHPNNIKRVIRALEYYHETGSPISAHNQQQRTKNSPYDFIYIVLTMNRQKLYARINKRVEQMFEQGLLEEAEALIRQGCTSDMTSMQAIGYKELFPYFEGKISREEAMEQIQQDTRHFAKRQLTWFRRERDVIFLDKDQFKEEETMVHEIVHLAEKRGIINHEE
ncbi:MAG: tRNA (adenosine(37)-N6)-dimethylallyltransferase MiaA [Eubacterium sp.]|nr:tRNA (adenosine(37)-N6)-dimethylallyltransferase MiaA [Eubacterium sp.]